MRLVVPRPLWPIGALALAPPLLIALASAAGPADPPPNSPVNPSSEAWIAVAPTAFAPTMPLPPDLLAALASRDHDTALGLLKSLDTTGWTADQRADLAFVQAWELLRVGKGADAAPLVDSLKAAPDAPPAYANLVVGEVLLASGDSTHAIAPLEAGAGSAPIEVRARLALAQAYQAASRQSDARKVWTDLAARPDPSPGTAEALWAIAGKDGLSAPATIASIRRIYRYYPDSGPDAAIAANPATKIAAPSLDDLAIRGDVLQERGSSIEAKTLLGPRLAEVPSNTAVGCQYRYAYGRAENKLNNVTDAADVLAPLGAGCKGIDDDRGAKALYLAGKSLERKQDWAGAARAYSAIPRLYPTHSMADDGYDLGGIAMQQAGDLTGAEQAWQSGFLAYPKGDLAGETAWRLAWGEWLEGRVPDALKWADACADGVPLATSPTDVLGCRYWAARWRAFPDPKAPATATKDPTALADAIARFERLATEDDWHYYGILATSRLTQLRPNQPPLTRQPMDPDDAPWQVRDAWLHSPAIQNAMDLVRVGLIGDALQEFGTFDDDSLGGSEIAIVTGTQTLGGDFLHAHDRLRSYLKTHPPETLGPNAWKVMRQAYPQKWWPEVQAATTGYAWDPQLFHGLVREESNFNEKIRSHAGACGLSQLMPATAYGVAKQIGLHYASADIWKPDVNLKIGAYYLNMLHARYNNDNALTLAAYNAGEGNVDKWLALQPDVALDEFVEAIPLRETRMYVKRVSSTWQTYRLLDETGPLYVDWSPFLVRAVPATSQGAAPTSAPSPAK